MLAWLQGQGHWLEETIVGIIISEVQNEVTDFHQWGVDIIPDRVLMKDGFETPDGRRVDVESAFKDPIQEYSMLFALNSRFIVQ